MSDDETVLLVLMNKEPDLSTTIRMLRSLVERNHEVVAATPIAMQEINEAVVEYREKS